jgi:hypothetical protein
VDDQSEVEISGDCGAYSSTLSNEDINGEFVSEYGFSGSGMPDECQNSSSVSDDDGLESANLTSDSCVRPDAEDFGTECLDTDTLQQDDNSNDRIDEGLTSDDDTSADPE